MRDKQYTLQMIERGRTMLIAKSEQHEPPRFLQIYEITPEWVALHFPDCRPNDSDIQQWLDSNA